MFENYNELKNLDYGFLTGPAGTGKTFAIQELLKEDPQWGCLCATTGVAAMNLGSKLGVKIPTLHALLKCATLDDFRKAFQSGALEKAMTGLKLGYKRLVIDECSMLLAEIFSYIYRACKRANLGLILIGDFLQLPPVVTKETNARPPYWCFQSIYWPEFTDGTNATNGKNIVRMTVNHRQQQSNSYFSDFLDAARKGDGVRAQSLFLTAGATWRNGLDDNFSGMTLVGTRNTRDRINDYHGGQLRGGSHTYVKSFFGEQTKDWLDIPKSVTLKVGAKAMILRNLYEGGVLVQANGTLGTIIDLHDDRAIVDTQRERLAVLMHSEDDSYWVQEWRDGKTRWTKIAATKGVTYMPLVHAWALTTHKAQGLTITDPLQIALDSHFNRVGGLLYVAASRVKDGSQLTFAADQGCLASRCFIDREVMMWI